MRVALRLLHPRQVGGVEIDHHAFGDHRHAVPAAAVQAFDDRADQRIDQGLETDRAHAEFLGDQRERRAGGFADAERQMPGFAAHRDHEVPAGSRLRVHHQVLQDLDAEVPGALVAERIHVGR